MATGLLAAGTASAQEPGARATAASAPASNPTGGPDRTLVLDETAYWRNYVQFGPDRVDPELLKSEGQKLLGEEGMKILQRTVKRWQRPDVADWRDEAWVWFSAGQGDSERAAMFSRSAAPPEEWVRPEFEAAQWNRQRLPFMMGNFVRPANMHGDKETQELLIRKACFRTSFNVPDPASAGQYVLSLRYRGGVRVFLNGSEIGMAGLPPGDLDEAATAQAYPAEAYLCQEDEMPRSSWDWEIKNVGVPFCEDLPGRFDDCARDLRQASPQEKKEKWWNNVGSSGFANYFGGFTTINRKGFDRITAVRNRAIGPITLRKELLRKGNNVLAVEVRAANIHPVVFTYQKGTRFGAPDWGAGFQRVMYWSHCRLLEASLTGPAAAPSGLKRPGGVQVWVEDMHTRCHTPDFSEQQGVGTVRFVGASNGTFSAQVVVGTGKELAGLKATMGELTGEDGAKIPASALSVLYGVAHPATEFVKLGQIRNMVEDRADPLCPPAEQAVIRYGGQAARAQRLPREQRLDIIKQIGFFDHLGGSTPKSVPADTCQPIWLSLKVPPGTPPGLYRGSLRVEAAGLEAVTVPVEAQIIGWNLPDPLHFQTFLGCEHSPYGVAKHYGVPLWSEEHFKLIDASFRQLGRLGNDMVFVPVLQNMEFGNYQDSPIRWIRGKGGKDLAIDFSILDRYLDVAAKHLGKPRVIIFAVMHGADRFGPGDKLAATVPVLDEATGQTIAMPVGSDAPGAREAWRAFCPALHAHLRKKGLERSMFWGLGWDGNADPALIPMLAEFLPEVKWTRASHGGPPDNLFQCVSNSIGPFLEETSKKGWKNPYIYLLCPRSGNAVLSSNGHSPPFTYRLMPNRALVAGLCGLGRLGADYWADIYFQGYKGMLSGGIAGMPCSNLLYPGPAGAESSARFEALIEGVQEAEARIFLEQALERKVLDEDLAARARDALNRHHVETLFISPGRVGVQIHEYSSGWQGRTRRLFEAAAAVAQAAPFDVAVSKLSLKVDARYRLPVEAAIRNWTTKPRAWKASASADWLILGKSEGTLLGQQTLNLAIDSGKLTPEKRAEGQVVVTDVASGREFPIKIAADVGPVFKLLVPQGFDGLGAPGHAASWHPKHIGDFATFNVPAGEQESREFALANLSGTDIAWQITSPVPWLAVEPASGKLAAGLRTFVKLTARPAMPAGAAKDAAGATLEAALTVAEVNGPARQEAKVVAHVIPTYREPALPKGEPVELKDVPEERVKSHKSRAYWFGSSEPGRADYGPRFGVFEHSGKVPPTTLSGGVDQETVYSLPGSGFNAFSAKVELSKGARAKANFEIWVDGVLKAQSGLVGAAEPRLLVVEGLESAKHIRLLVRFDRPEWTSYKDLLMHWHEPRFYR